MIQIKPNIPLCGAMRGQSLQGILKHAKLPERTIRPRSLREKTDMPILLAKLLSDQEPQ